jgi:hypothetical protein
MCRIGHPAGNDGKKIAFVGNNDIHGLKFMNVE